MNPSTTQNSRTKLQIDDTLLDAIVGGTLEGLQMTAVQPAPVGASRFFTATRPISVIVGLVGRNNGTVTLNLSERGMTFLAGRLLCDDNVLVDESTFDAIGEIGNMIAGRVKEMLLGSAYEVEHISVPSLVLGANYNVYYTRGMNSVSVEFELTEIPVTQQKDRFFSVTVSMLQQLG